MRVAAAGLAAILAAIALALHSGARADQTNPFPSPSPVASVVPGFGGYAFFAVSSLSAGGGTIPVVSGTATPAPFRGVPATGYAFDVFSRMSGSYAARIRYQDTSIHGDDDPIASRFDGSIFYTGGSRAEIGIGIVSLQRSNVGSSENAFGIGAGMQPDFTKRFSTYLDADIYPALPAPLGKRGSLDVFDGGAVFMNPGSSATFERLGFTGQVFNANSTSPVSLWGLDLGFGASF